MGTEATGGFPDARRSLWAVTRGYRGPVVFQCVLYGQGAGPSIDGNADGDVGNIADRTGVCHSAQHGEGIHDQDHARGRYFTAHDQSPYASPGEVVYRIRCHTRRHDDSVDSNSEMG